MMGEGLAASFVTPTNTYGDGSSNTVKHHYAGTMKATKKKKKEKNK